MKSGFIFITNSNLLLYGVKGLESMHGKETAKETWLSHYLRIPTKQCLDGLCLLALESEHNLISAIMQVPVLH